MKKALLGIFLLITVTGFSQKDQIKVLAIEKTFGKSFLDSSDIKGFEYVFPKRIHEAFLDTTTGYLTVQLRGLSPNGKWLDNTGNIVQYDIRGKKILWTRKIAYMTSSLLQFSKTMLFTVANKSYCLDINSGNELWEVKNNIYFTDPLNNIGIGYKFKNSTGFTNELEGIDLKTGNVIWKRDLNREYGWDNLFYSDDSTIIVVAAGLHSININNGRGWDYNTITGKKDYKGTAAANAVGIAAGLLTGAFLMSTGYNLVRDLVSNTIIDSSSIYFASKEQLVKINKQSGVIDWKYSFPDGIASKSSIFINDSTVFMINKGIAFMGYRQLDFGKPFFAAFDRQTGRQVFFSLINDGDDPVMSFQMLDNEIYLLFKNRIKKYSMVTGNLIAEKEFPEDSFGELKYFIGNQVFITGANGDLLSLPQSDSTKVFIYTNERKTIPTDPQLNVGKTIEYDDLSIYFLRTRDLKFFSKNTLTSVVNREGKKIAEIEVTSNANLIDNTLFDTKDKSLIIINLDGLIKN